MSACRSAGDVVLIDGVAHDHLIKDPDAYSGPAYVYMTRCDVWVWKTAEHMEEWDRRYTARTRDISDLPCEISQEGLVTCMMCICG